MGIEIKISAEVYFFIWMRQFHETLTQAYEQHKQELEYSVGYGGIMIGAGKMSFGEYCRYAFEKHPYIIDYSNN